MLSPSVKSIITEASKASEVSNPNETTRSSEHYSPLELYPINLSHAFMPEPDLKDTDKRLRSSMRLI
jgi:hypothetical protein